MRYLLVLLLLTLTTALMAQTYADDYARLEALAEKGQFRSALALADSIYRRAAAEGARDQLVRALGYRVTYTQATSEDEGEAGLALLRGALAAEGDDPVVAALLHVTLGKLYFSYAERNQYRLREVSEVARVVVSDSLPLADYTLGQLLDTGRSHLYRGLELLRDNRTALTAVPALVAGGPARRDELPTLYDLLVGEVQALFSSSLGSLTDERPADAAALLVPAAEFVAIDLAARYDTTQSSIRTLRLYQEWVGYHLGEGSAALLYADLQRVSYVHQLGAADSSYLATLERMYDAYAGNPLRDRLLVAQAELLDREEEGLGSLPRVRALQLLNRVGEGDELARVEAARLRAAITAPSLSSQVQAFYPRRNHLLVQLGYRNVERVFYRVYRYDPAVEEGYLPDASERLARIAAQEPVATGSQRLVANDDYSAHTTELDLDPLPAGGYRIVFADAAAFDPETSVLNVATLQVTDLSTLMLSGADDGSVQVVDRTTGAARPGTEVTIRERLRRRQGGYRTVATRTADREGRFELPTTKNYANYQLVLTDPATDDRLVTDAYAYQQDRASREPQEFTTLLTDRPLYRPGQTVHVYGLRYRSEANGLPTLLPNATSAVTLRDANYQEVERRGVTTDAYGRYSLSFTLPEGGLTGEFTLEAPGGSVNFRVEEYKRPRFEVTLDAPDAVVAGRPVTVDGEALTYAGPAVAEARVNYRVYVEEVRWYYFRRFDGGGGGERELVSSGTTVTDQDGQFTLDFTPSATRVPTGYRRFRYVVEADVADATGETHAATISLALRGDRPAVAVVPGQESIDAGDTLTLRAESDRRDTVLTLALTITPVTKPNAALLDRDWGIPDRPVINPAAFARNFRYLAYAPVPELTEWPTAGAAVYETVLTVRGGSTTVTLPANFPVGHYRIDFTYPDGTAGEPATFSVFNAATADLPTGVLYQIAQQADSLRVGTPVTLTLLSALDLPLVVHRWASRKEVLFDRDSTTNRRLTLTYLPTEADRGGIFHSLVFVRLNRMVQENRQLPLHWENKQLHVRYRSFRSRLRPGQPEQWTLELRTNDSLPAAAAALATMYDASLDQLYSGGGWQFSPYPTYGGTGALTGNADFGSRSGEELTRPNNPPTDTLPELPYLLLPQFDDYGRLFKTMAQSVRMRGASTLNESVESEVTEEAAFMDADASDAAAPPPPVPTSAGAAAPPPPVDIRSDLRETAFWLPELTAGPDGALQVSFTSPEALTAWKFRLFAHDQQLNYVMDEREVVTQKELMVLPNVPRFLREGDRLELTARVSNLTEAAMDATVTLELFDPTTLNPLTPSQLNAFSPGGGAAGGSIPEQQVALAAGTSATVRFPLAVPESASPNGPLGYRIIARSADFSDGEENVVPILTDRTLVTVAQPFYLKRGKTITLTLDALNSLTPSNPNPLTPSPSPVSYTFQATTNPAWLALKALPYLMEYPYDCTEQLANRYFANQLAYATVSGKPALDEVFREWEADSTALLSELEKNQDLKNALLTETPWVREAQSESAQRARIGELFQLKRLAKEQRDALTKLTARQESDGSYSWFPGGPANRYMTQYVVETLARMRELGVVTDEQTKPVDRITTRAVEYLDAELEEDYQRYLAATERTPDERADYRPSALHVHYLYARAVSGQPVAKGNAALAFYQKQAFAHWLDYGLYEQALLAITAATQGDALATTVLTSLRERALHADEFGMYWKYDRGYRWNNLPIETHTRLLEAFRRIDPREDELDDMRLWLLTNKRTNAWPTTKATAAAVYALLNTGSTYTVDRSTEAIAVDWPAHPGKLSSRVRALQENSEAATGAFELRLPVAEVTTELATVRVHNPGSDLVWGGVFYQYIAPADQVAASADGPLSLERTLYRKVDDVLQPITPDDPLHPGDRITVRLTLRSDRDLDFVHLKDRRAATFEPVDALSTYRYQNGLGYYFAPGDLATNFFIDDLPKGTYVLEYDLFTTYTGEFSNGLGRVQCMYAPEFGGNTAGSRIRVE